MLFNIRANMKALPIATFVRRIGQLIFVLIVFLIIVRLVWSITGEIQLQVTISYNNNINEC